MFILIFSSCIPNDEGIEFDPNGKPLENNYINYKNLPSKLLAYEIKERTDSTVKVYIKLEREAYFKIQYGKNIDILSETEFSREYFTEHILSLDNLESNSRYSFRVIMKTEYGVSSISKFIEFQTLVSAE